MRITCVTMVRNEGAIIHEFAAHLLDLFDDILIVDHMSDDGTAEFLHALHEVNPGVHVIELRNKGYFQSAAMTALCAGSSTVAQSDWVFFLDADEFLPFQSRAEFEVALSLYRDSSLIKMPWHNLVPVSYDRNSMLRRTFLVPKTPAQHRKAAFQPRLMSSWPIVVDQGNHEILAFEGGGPLPAGDVFPMLHIPIRTFEQLESKLTNGLKSYRDMGAKWAEDLGTHWVDIEKALERGELSEDMANFVAARYGDLPQGQPWSLTRQKMDDLGYVECVLHGALLEPSERLRDAYWTGPKGDAAPKASSWIEIDEETGRGRYFEDGELSVSVTLGDNPPEPEEKTFGPLSSARPAARLGSDQEDPLIRFLENADHSIDCMVPTSWGGHIPFMYAL
ncbi:MAG: glycosyltransferase family 2 protein, partial [Pseudomonadota bacterium]